MAVDAARAKSLFLAASDLANPTERADYLERECGGDVELRGRVEALLRANADAPSPLAETGDGTGTRVPDRRPQAEDDRDPTARLGATLLGKYQLVEAIGEGGMGTVYLAEQTQPVRRAVAVKVIKAGMGSRAVLARFEAERQALAMMDHPNIAKVLDAGATEGGRPFFVMELVKGATITRYCDEQRLTPRQRLELFVPVCHALQHAHQKGIIHRDIKPSNVLVARYDDRPVPKVIDFGVAKAAGQPLTERSLMTGLGTVVGTAEYMSPEQANLNDLDVDTRSDVYSLGVLLYELLTGTTPVDRQSLGKAAFLEILRIVREVDVPRPSARLSTIETLPSVAANRSTEPAKLSKLLKGELDWVVLKALEKDRTRRYETANGLARDIQRYLADEVVEARPPSPGYRLQKFIHRNRVVVTAGAAVAAALLTGVVAFAWQAYEARDQRDIAVAARNAEAQQRQAAEAQRQKAETIAEFMSQTLNGVGPSKARGRDVTMLKEMMDAAAARIEKGDLRSTPEAELRLRQTIGITYVELAQFPEAARMLEPAEPLARSLNAGDHDSMVETLDALARLRSAQGELARAERLWREALEMLGRLSPTGGEKTALIQNNLAVLLQRCGDLAGAEPLYRAALATRRRLFSGDREDIAVSLNCMAFLLRARGDQAGAESFCRESLAMFQRLYPGDHPDVATELNNLGILLLQRGDLAGAEPNLRAALAMMKRLHPGDHPNVAGLLSSVAGVVATRGDTERAVPLYREALEMRRRLFPGDHPAVATGMSNFGRALQRWGDVAQAEPLLRDSLAMYQRLFPGDHPDVADGLGNLGELLNGRGERAEAERLCRESLAMDRRLFAGDHPDVANALTRLADVLLSRGNFAGAAPLAGEGAAMSKQTKGKDHWRTGLARLTSGRALAGMNRAAEAEVELIECERVLSKAPGVPPGRHRQCVEDLVVLYESWGKAEPGKAYDAKADRWRMELKAITAAQKPETKP
jgi:serine/threonine protein kinase/tetratricopeptide (TPR) repeat protein